MLKSRFHCEKIAVNIGLSIWKKQWSKSSNMSLRCIAPWDAYLHFKSSCPTLYLALVNELNHHEVFSDCGSSETQYLHLHVAAPFLSLIPITNCPSIYKLPDSLLLPWKLGMQTIKFPNLLLIIIETKSLFTVLHNIKGISFWNRFVPFLFLYSVLWNMESGLFKFRVNRVSFLSISWDVFIKFTDFLITIFLIEHQQKLKFLLETLCVTLR